LNWESWNRYVSNIEYDTHGAQIMAYKTTSHLIKQKNILLQLIS
jgi:hypothetical protein